MSDFDHLKDRLRRGYISRRNFVRSAIALGVTASTAISIARTSYAADGDKLVEAREGFPVTRRAKLRHPGLDGRSWNADDPLDMFRYTTALLKSAIQDAKNDKTTHYLEDAFLGYAISLAASESWIFDADKNREEFQLQASGRSSMESTAIDLARNAATQLKGDEDEVQARWALAIIYMNFGQADNAVAEYKAIETGQSTIKPLPAEEEVNFAFEKADALVHSGEVDEAISMLQSETARVDWHLHQLAWCYFVRAGRQTTPLRRLRDYDIALSFLDKRQNAPGTPGHLALADLLESACYAQKAMVFEGAKEPKGKERMDAKARGRLGRVRSDNANLARWTLQEADNYAPFSGVNNNPADAEHWKDALRRVGVV